MGIVGNYSISVDYSHENAIAKAIQLNGFDNIWIEGIDLNAIPLGGHGKTIERVHQVGFGVCVSNQELPQLLATGHGYGPGFGGYELANALTALEYARKWQDRQRKNSLGINFSVGLQMYALHLHGSMLERNLEIVPTHPAARWLPNTDFLAVANSAKRRLAVRCARPAHA